MNFNLPSGRIEDYSFLILPYKFVTSKDENRQRNLYWAEKYQIVMQYHDNLLSQKIIWFGFLRFFDFNILGGLLI